MARRAYHDKDFHKHLTRMMKVHGDYTEGFHKRELDALRGKIGGGI